MKRLAVLVCLVALVPCVSAARTWYVKADGTGDAPTIPAAADSAAYGDTILVAPGTYAYESVEDDYWVEVPSGVSLIGSGGLDSTFIKGPYWTQMLGASNARDLTIKGFTFTPAGESGYLLYGIIIEDAWNSTIDSCRFENLEVGILFAGSHSPSLIRDCQFSNCMYGLDCWDVPTIDDLVIENNTLTRCFEGITCYDAAPSIIGNLISQSDVTGIIFQGCSPALLVRNVITNNAYNGLVINTQVFCEPYFGGEVMPSDGNDIYGNGDYDVYSAVSDTRSVVNLPLTYWGTLCPDPGKIVAYKGSINYIPWTGPGHAGVYLECPGATEASTWGSIKAMFR